MKPQLQTLPGQLGVGDVVPRTARPLGLDPRNLPMRPEGLAAPGGTRAPLWSRPPANVTAGPDEVHVWRASLDRPAHETRVLYQTLSSDEHERASRFFCRRARDHFIVGRAVLRMILAGYVHELPRRLRFDYGPHGKPALAHDGKPHATHFNVSHSQGLAVYAITRGKEIPSSVRALVLSIIQ